MTQKYDLKSLKATFADHAAKSDEHRNKINEQHFLEYGEPYPYAHDDFNVCKAFLAILDELESLREAHECLSDWVHETGRYDG